MSETLLPVLYTTTQLRQAEMPKSAFFLERYTLKVSNFQKQIFLFSFEPKTEQNYFLIFGSKMGQVKKLLSIVLNTP